MMKLFDITQKYGKATYAYPFEPYKVQENFRGQPTYTYELCIGCAACGVACPSNAIEVKMNESKDKLIWRFDCARCIFCGRCDEVCPTRAVKLSDSFELAVKFDKSALIQKGELEIQKCKCCGKPFVSKRLINYTFEKLSSANLLPDRLEEAKEYLYICPECKKANSVKRITRGEEKGMK
ncbi:formate hydrogenlyase complex iron-sulfur subunit [Campylobacter geochelonis]|uniref:Formate hydrogenlyase complex iron-sulfur subunit n=1 Tax=Campylobacter geochelonis TaxID=1780362 RepID=A0A128EHQ2_9BACT|nr:formate hydrogenlyase complex iron-sulfur subunit [Campylobacter geochelonis]QKF71928.1 hydrogenase-4, iron-sulfur protein [Campylobacter geochelonis]CZE47858.1 formate hydrogenlyase complex iron-sulfur subunit [Campylobacter geochelonis]